MSLLCVHVHYRKERKLRPSMLAGKSLCLPSNKRKEQTFIKEWDIIRLVSYRRNTLCNPDSNLEALNKRDRNNKTNSLYR